MMQSKEITRTEFVQWLIVTILKFGIVIALMIGAIIWIRGDVEPPSCIISGGKLASK